MIGFPIFTTIPLKKAVLDNNGNNNFTGDEKCEVIQTKL